MKKTLTVLMLILCSPSSALEIQFIGPCSERPFYSTTLTTTEATNVGHLSVMVLEKAQIPFEGTEMGLNQILSSPIGQDAMEVISDQEMMAYGWCYEVDGIIPDVYSNEVSLEGVKVIKWFYAYAHYLNGQWVAQCVKSYSRRSPFICGE